MLASLFLKVGRKTANKKDVDSNTEETTASPKPIHHTFKLPVSYLDSSLIHSLPTTVCSDLELTTIDNTKPTMYEYLFKPKHEFAKNMIPEWSKQITSHVPFLQDTQMVLCNIHEFNEKTPKDYKVPCDKIMDIWNDTKEDKHFLEKYSYIDWDIFKSFNESSSFLQALTLINMTSPLISFIIPIIFLVFPFVILKFQRIPITFDVYLKVLRDIAKHHFIGRAIGSFQNISWTSVIYLGLTIGLYGLQIYQNVNLCIRFYNNINKINTHLCNLRDYLKYSIDNMENFTKINNQLDTYSSFCSNTTNNCITLKCLYEEVKDIRPFIPGFSKITEIGYLLKCFYRVHSNQEYEMALRYSFGFEGYIDNLRGVYENMIQGNVHCSVFGKDNCEIVDEYYPSLLNEKNVVKNNCELSKNMVITGPNASGKTTILKTTTINIIFTQQVGCGFYTKATINPYTHIHSYLNIPDTSGRDSLFQAESRRCKEILDIINNTENNSRHFCIYDELYSGTNPSEATKSAYAFLKYLSKYENVDFVLTTHYVSLCKKLKKTKKIQNYQMVVNIEHETNKIEYTYKIKKGISKVQGAVMILEDMKYPDEIINDIRRN